MVEQKSLYLQGNFAPWRSEDSFENLEVIGKIPEDLNGVLVRNGPNPQFDPIGPYHWFKGDGMLHAVRIHNGKATYDNRWIRTQRFNTENEIGKSLFNNNLNPDNDDSSVKDCSGNTANTNIVQFNGKLLALNEGYSPVSIELTNLHTLGDYTYNGQIEYPLSAHPRFDYQRKELLTYSYTNEDGHLMYYRLNSDNTLITEKVINWPCPVMLHDFVITENYVIFPLFPCTFSADNIKHVGNIFMWEGDRLNTLLLITDRNGNEITRIETTPSYAYHFGNAYEEGDTINIDLMHGRCTGLMPDRHGKVATRADTAARAARWTINMKTNTVSLNFHDEIYGEFPRFDERFNGHPYRHLYTCGKSYPGDLFDRLIHYDLVRGVHYEHSFGVDVPSEPVFVPRSDKEGDGYLLTMVYRREEDRSDLVILDANSITDEPIATIKIPHRVPFGFHGNFISL